MASPAIDYDALAKQYGAVSSTPAATAPAAIDYDALAKQHGAISSTGGTPQVESSIRYLTTEDYQPPPPEPGAVARFGKRYTAQTGINDLLDIIRASNRYGTPQEVAARGEKAQTALGHVVTGLRDEPARVWSEIGGIGQSMLDPKQNTADMSMHMLGAIPMFGPSLQGFVQDVWAKKYPEAAADLAALATVTKGPKIIEAAGEALPGAMQAARTAAAATAGGLKGGLTAAVQRPPYGAALVGEALGGHKGAAIAAGLAKAPSVIRGTIKGARTALADTAAAEAAAEAARVAAAMENPPPGAAILSPDYFDRLRLGPGPVIPPAPPDASFVRAVPAQYPDIIPPHLRANAPAENAAISLRDLMRESGTLPPETPPAAPEPAAPEAANQFEAYARIAKAERLAKAAKESGLTAQDAHDMIADEAARNAFAQGMREESVSPQTMAMIEEQLRKLQPPKPRTARKPQ